MTFPILYLITDRKGVPENDLLAAVAAALDGGVRMVQLREKDLPTEQLLPLAEDLRRLTEGYQARLLINGQIDVALACDADGVHLGGHSLPTTEARRLLGPERLIGVSTHNLDELSNAETCGADFVTFGPVFATPSKLPLGNPVGLTALAEACRSTRLPVYALGGVDAAQLAAVRASGAAGFACIRAILASPEPKSSTAGLLSNWQQA